MIGAISNNTLLAALFGPGISRAPGRTTGGQPHASIQSDETAHEQDSVELSSAARASVNDPNAGANRASQPADPEQQEVRELKKRDAEVRRHEAAHKGAAGPHANGGPKFEFQEGPDGKQYAVGGEVSIDTSEVAGNPSATIRKMQQVRRAALAPANPSAQDRAVAAQAAKLEQKARAEVSGKQSEIATQQENPVTPFNDTDHSSRGQIMNVIA